MNNEDKLFKFMMEVNLSWTSEFHNRLNLALKEKYDDISDSQSSEHIRLKHVYKDGFPAKLRETTFLLMFGHFEEMMFLLWRDKNSKSISLGSGYGILKFKPYIRDILGDSLSINKDYQTIRDAQLVRNSLIHIAGRVSLSKDREKLELLIKNNSSLYYLENDRVNISIAGLQKIHSAIDGFTGTLHEMSIAEKC